MQLISVKTLNRSHTGIFKRPIIESLFHPDPSRFRFRRDQQFSFLTNFAGFPAHISLAGMLLVIIEPAPTTALDPI